jgi:hydrogenase nickel incorporation protein HypA/HybF
MHEYHALESVINLVVKEAKARHAHRVSKVKLVMGKFLGFDESSVRLYFELLSAGTIAAGAQLQIEYGDTTNHTIDGSRGLYIENIEVEI